MPRQLSCRGMCRNCDLKALPEWKLQQNEFMQDFSYELIPALWNGFLSLCAHFIHSRAVQMLWPRKVISQQCLRMLRDLVSLSLHDKGHMCELGWHNFLSYSRKSSFSMTFEDLTKWGHHHRLVGLSRWSCQHYHSARRPQRALCRPRLQRKNDHKIARKQFLKHSVIKTLSLHRCDVNSVFTITGSLSR